MASTANSPDLTKKAFSPLVKSRVSFFVILAVILGICDLLTSGRFLSGGNILLVTTHTIFYTFVSWGMIFIFTTGIIDLSIGANVILAANLGALCAMDFGMGYPGLIIATIASAIIFEIISVLCSVQLSIPSWISGLGMALIYEAILSIYAGYRAKTAGTNVIILKDFRAVGTVPVMLVCLVSGFIIVYILFNKTTLGFNITAVGDNGKVAEAMGIKKKRTILIGALIGGLFIGIGALIQESYVGKFYPQTGLSSLSSIFRSLAILLLGQSFSRIFSMPVSIFICSLLTLGLFNFLTMIGVPSGTGQEMCLGILVILCGVFSHWNYKGVMK